jgi:hypothetical protein
MMTPTLAQVIEDPRRATDVSDDLLPQYIGSLAQLLSRAEVAMGALTRRLPVVFNGKTVQTASGDRLLDVHEAAKKLGRSEDWLYRNAKKLPFTVRNPDGRGVQFSEQGIEEDIRNRRKGGRG